jgi:hypothetical protein
MDIREYCIKYCNDMGWYGIEPRIKQASRWEMAMFRKWRFIAGKLSSEIGDFPTGHF